jgi:hypothetical protein
MTFDDIQVVRIEVRIVEHSQKAHPYYDQLWLLKWGDDLTLDVTQMIGNGRGATGCNPGTERTYSDPREFAEFLREMADNIDMLVDLEEDAQDEFEERAAIIEHDGNLSRDQAEVAAQAELFA